MKKVGILVGSLRKDSLNKIVAEKVAELFPADVETVFLDLDMPVYNEDYDSDTLETPASYDAFRKTGHEVDAFVIVSPEYNRSLPATVKNAIDVGSRPWGQSIWNQKPVLVISVSPSGLAGALSNHAIRQALVFNESLVLTQPEMYINAATSIENGQVVEKTVEFLQSGVDAFVEFARR
ncbi:MAG: NAD(P)H-dependent oxidoreductase [Clostridiaceae bacterium]|nr:NAD(P)H-dependent oxidoreductase [Clostridiaceae bacterium]